MEIALVSKDFIKIKGKQASLGINPTDKNISFNAAILLGKPQGSKISDDAIIIDGPGEYEVGGIKISGLRAEEETVYSVLVDDVQIIIGNINALVKAQTKLQDTHVVLVQADTAVDVSFITGLTPNAVLFFGEKAEEVVSSFEKEGVQKANKYQVTVEKLPQELVTVLLN